ncbi:MAG: tetratricopeptide repeat protein [Deltaproteobacteria bacterium]|nr:tetratricopeptide repeat protein [Deltaproteobacteria bacterium]
MRKMLPLLLGAFIIFGTGAVSFAKTETIPATGKFVMGDRDSKSDAKKLALMNAKQMALEKAGTYLESSSEVKNFQLTNDEITSLAAGVISVEILDEKWTLAGESPVVTITIRATINTEGLEQRINSLRDDPGTTEDFKNIQAELVRLKQELETLKQKEKKEASSDEKKIVNDQKKETLNRMIALGNVNDASAKMMQPQGPVEDAITGFDDAIARDPNNFIAYLKRSEAHARAGRMQVALSDIEKALQINPNNPRALVTKGRILLRAGQYGPAVQQFSRVIEMKPDCGPCYRFRGDGLVKLKRFRPAFMNYKKACELGVKAACRRAKFMAEKAKKLRQKDQQGKKRRKK